MDPNQRERRLEKRALKRKGNQRARRQAHRALVENPAEAHLEPDPDYGRFRTADLNGQDHDATRRSRGAHVAPPSSSLEIGYEEPQ